MRVLIIGGTGSISSYLVDELLKRGDHVTIITRGNVPVPDECESIVANRNEPQSFARAIAQWEGDVSLDFICFLPQHAQCVYEALKGRVKQHIFISTAAAYDKTRPDCIPLTDDSPHGGKWEYANLKTACENYFLDRHKEGFPITIVRPSHTLGISRIPSPLGSQGYTVPARILAGKPIVMHDDGQKLWTLTASWDFAVALEGLVGNEEAVGEAFHITHDSVLTWNAIVQELGMALGVEPIVRYIPLDRICKVVPEIEGGMRYDKGLHTVFDNAKIKRFVPGFECKTSFREFLQESLVWYNEDESRKKIDPASDEIIERLLAAQQ